MPSQASETKSTPSQGKRKTSLGTVPDFSYSGPGVRIDDVLPGSSAQLAQLQKGDIVSKLAGQPISDLASYSAVLKTLAPGQTVELQYQRDNQLKTIEITLTER